MDDNRQEESSVKKAESDSPDQNSQAVAQETAQDKTAPETEGADASAQTEQTAAPETEGADEPAQTAAPEAESTQEAEADTSADLEQDERDEFLAAMEGDFEVRESKRGEMVKGTVISLGREYAFIDLGGKSEGVLSLEELRGDGDELPEVGDEVEACVISKGPSGLILSKKLAKGIRDREFLGEAHRNKIPIEGRVLERNKGGFTVDIAGLRAFCPISQIELRYCEEPDEHLGQRYTFLLTKYDDSGRRPDVVVSRKVLLQAEAEREAAELRESLSEGDVVNGTVRNIRDFGAFVDIGGLDGLLPISELSYSRVDKVTDVLSEGDQIHVQVVSFDREKDRISLSLKRLEADPWEDVVGSFPEGIRLIGKVVRLQPFGAFVELAPGVDGLIHVSNFNTPERISHPNKVVSEGQELEVQVMSVDPSKRRIGLARVPKDGEFGDVPVIGVVMEGEVESVAQFGVFVKLGPGRKGLIPNVELGTPKGADNRKEFKPGLKLKVKVLEVTDNGRKIRLSRKEALEDAERAVYQDFLTKEEKGSGGGFGTLGDLLKKKLDN